MVEKEAAPRGTLQGNAMHPPAIFAAQGAAMRQVLIALLLVAAPVVAQPPPQCTAETEGQAVCMAGKLCECRFERGGQMTGRPDRFAWDCGVMRPPCPPDPTIQPAQPWTAPGGLLIVPRGLRP
ncbi:hypothetical protein Rmf_44990 [Roseomonas fluvialis]|uniref:Secreted protein n=1 Tax=Roseomonas fluvialis TaxID=1750527 RepID=A0ABM7Y939_9PROT|nr:hypothetical protein Rmf_44990 [Roseomonas fluvialis]